MYCGRYGYRLWETQKKKPGGSFTGKMCFSDVCYSRHCSCFGYGFFTGFEPIPGVISLEFMGTINILVVAYITRYLVLQIKGSTIALLSVEPAIEEACAASGRGFWIKWIKILIPLVAGPILSGAFMIFVPAFTELTLSSMLASAGTKTIGLTIFNYQQGGDYNLAAAMSVLITILVVAGYCLLNRDHLTSVKQEENGYELHIQQVTKTFSKTQALKEINLDIRDSEFVAILGPSGCGKTTLLRIVGAL